jgi:hypothetical protein
LRLLLDQDTLDKFFGQAHESCHDQYAPNHRRNVFLGLPVKGGSTDHHVNKPPSGGFVVSDGT